MSEVICKVESVQPFSDSVFHVVLQPQQPVAYEAGQYLMVKMADDDLRPFSIANAPSTGDHLELHIGAGEKQSYPMQVIERLQQVEEITVVAPNGKAQLRDNDSHPLILLAGGTGFSYVKSILEELIARKHRQPIFLYWGARRREQLYHYEVAQQWAADNNNVHFVPVVEEAEADWQGHTGRVHEAVLKDFIGLADYQVYAAGRFEMIGVVRDAFIEHGLHPENIFGDALEFI